MPWATSSASPGARPHARVTSSSGFRPSSAAVCHGHAREKRDRPAPSTFSGSGLLIQLNKSITVVCGPHPFTRVFPPPFTGLAHPLRLLPVSPRRRAAFARWSTWSHAQTHLARWFSCFRQFFCWLNLFQAAEQRCRLENRVLCFHFPTRNDLTPTHSFPCPRPSGAASCRAREESHQNVASVRACRSTQVM